MFGRQPVYRPYPRTQALPKVTPAEFHEIVATRAHRVTESKEQQRRDENWYKADQDLTRQFGAHNFCEGQQQVAAYYNHLNRKDSDAVTDWLEAEQAELPNFEVLKAAA